MSLSAQILQKTKRQGSDGTVAAPLSFDPNADEATRKRVFERDENACQYCGFESKKFQVVHVKDGNPRNTADNNLVTSCIFCHQCFHIDQVGGMKSGVLIWMPELSQAQIHHLARSLYVARITQGPMAETARKSIEMVMKRREEAIERLKTDDPKILSLVMSDYLDRGQYKKAIEKLDGIRLFPLDRRAIKEGDLEFNQFPQILAYWRSKDGPFGQMMPQGWLDRYQELKQAA
ncbi:MAG: type IV secretion protein DotN [Alphaproteobacteria bacterium]|nr:MAG: type IV secretion protein DotN [Alphaproteobacteria bacterium]